MTNGDKIRQMTDDELADFLHSIVKHCREEYCDSSCPLWYCCARDAFWQEKWIKRDSEEVNDDE